LYEFQFCSPPNKLSRRPVSFGVNTLVCYTRGLNGNVERRHETRMVKAIHAWKPNSKRPMGRPKISWEYDTKKDIQRLKVPNLKTFIQDSR
jgi:hypothetical protein